MIAAVIVWKLDSRDRKLIYFEHVPLFSWLLVAAVIFPLLALSTLAVDIFVLLLELSLSMFDNVHYVLMGLSKALRCATWLRMSSSAVLPHGKLCPHSE
jgi:heme/copper-type cytochrome/quinol oxidase subunit 1